MKRLTVSIPDEAKGTITVLLDYVNAKGPISKDMAKAWHSFNLSQASSEAFLIRSGCKAYWHADVATDNLETIRELNKELEEIKESIINLRRMLEDDDGEKEVMNC